jgi:hypothetical protein
VVTFSDDFQLKFLYPFLIAYEWYNALHSKYEMSRCFLIGLRNFLNRPWKSWKILSDYIICIAKSGSLIWKTNLGQHSLTEETSFLTVDYVQGAKPPGSETAAYHSACHFDWRQYVCKLTVNSVTSCLQRPDLNTAPCHNKWHRIHSSIASLSLTWKFPYILV